MPNRPSEVEANHAIPPRRWSGSRPCSTSHALATSSPPQRVDQPAFECLAAGEDRSVGQAREPAGAEGCAGRSTEIAENPVIAVHTTKRTQHLRASSSVVGVKGLGSA